MKPKIQDDPTIATKVIARRKNGQSYREIATALGITEQQARRCTSAVIPKKKLRTYSSEERQEVINAALDHLAAKGNFVEFCRQRRIPPATVHNWLHARPATTTSTTVIDSSPSPSSPTPSHGGIQAGEPQATL